MFSDRHKKHCANKTLQPQTESQRLFSKKLLNFVVMQSSTASSVLPVVVKERHSFNLIIKSCFYIHMLLEDYEGPVSTARLCRIE
jgi:hypothetical protein